MNPDAIREKERLAHVEQGRFESDTHAVRSAFRESLDMRRADAREAICFAVGYTQDYDSALKKLALNSLHAYFTGEFYFPRKHYGTSQSPDATRVRSGVADAVVWAMGDDTMAVPLEVYVGEREAGDHDGRQFNREELRAIVVALAGVDDERGWT